MGLLKWVPAIFSLWVAAAGWYYMFYSKAASRLSGIENDAANRRRVRLRQTNGFVILLLAMCFYAGLVTFDIDRPNVSLFVVWVMAVLLLLCTTMTLGLADLRLTLKLKRDQQVRSRI